MIFRLPAHLFRLSNVRAVEIIALLRGAAMRGHTIQVVEDVYGYETRETGDLNIWVKGHKNTLEKELLWLVERVHHISANAVTRGAISIAVSTSEEEFQPTSHIILSLTAAIRLASLPLFIIVENALSDAAFLRTVMPLRWKNKLTEWEKNGFVQFENGGGIDEMRRIVEYLATGKTEDPLGLGFAAWKAAHYLISDRDSKDNDGMPSDAAQKLKKVCNEKGLKYRLYVLRRRTQESYLPRPALEAIINTKTDKIVREDMQKQIDVYFSDPKKRNHDPLPKIGEMPWFKNSFLTSSINWESKWFDDDKSGSEMIEIAENIASLI